MKRVIRVRFVEKMPDGKMKKHETILAVDPDEKLRKMLHCASNDMASIEMLGKYSRGKLISIGFNGGTCEKYEYPFLINKRGRLKRIKSYYLHDWTFAELERMVNFGFDKKKNDCIIIQYPNGLGCLGGEEAMSVIREAVPSIVGWLLKKIYKFFHDRHNKLLEYSFVEQILLTREQWNIDFFASLFNIEISKASVVLSSHSYHEKNGLWIRLG